MTTDRNERTVTRLTSEARRLAILDNAEMVFVKTGFHSASTRAIAAACGVTEPVLYRHFNGKEALFLAVVSRMFDQSLQDLENSRDSDLAGHARSRILEAILLCVMAGEIEGIDRLIQPLREGLMSIFPQDASSSGQSGLAYHLGELLLERLEIG